MREYMGRGRREWWRRYQNTQKPFITIQQYTLCCLYILQNLFVVICNPCGDVFRKLTLSDFIPCKLSHFNKVLEHARVYLAHFQVL